MTNALFLLIKFGAVLSDIVFPSNTAVMRGDKMSMTCKPTNYSIVRKWEIFNSNRTTSTIIPESPIKLRREFMHFGVEVNPNGPVTIYANSTRSSDAGIYMCRCEIEGKDAEYKAHLIVIETLPVCESNLTSNYTDSFIDGDQIWIQCSVNYRGFWALSMEWIQHGDSFEPEGKNLTNGIATMHRTNQSITSTLTIAAHSSTNGSYYSCKIYFDQYDGSEVTTAKNVPSYTYIWNSSVIYVSHSSTQSVFSVSDAGTPTADTLPTDKPFSVDWYLVSLSLVAAFAIFFIVMVVRAIVRCNRFKKQVSDNYASTNKETIELPTLESSNYEFIPYATSDNYETMIGEEDTDPSVVLSLRPRIGQLPTPGYAGLEERKPSAPDVYSRIEGYMSPVDIVPDSTITKVNVSIEDNPAQTFDELETEKIESQRKESLLNAHTYLEVRE